MLKIPTIFYVMEYIMGVKMEERYTFPHDSMEIVIGEIPSSK